MESRQDCELKKVTGRRAVGKAAGSRQQLRQSFPRRNRIKEVRPPCETFRRCSERYFKTRLLVFLTVFTFFKKYLLVNPSGVQCCKANMASLKAESDFSGQT
jgi:hypothetical protein